MTYKRLILLALAYVAIASAQDPFSCVSWCPAQCVACHSNMTMAPDQSKGFVGPQQCIPCGQDGAPIANKPSRDNLTPRGIEAREKWRAKAKPGAKFDHSPYVGKALIDQVLQSSGRCQTK